MRFCDLNANAWQVWKLIPVEAESVDTPDLLSSETFDFLPRYDGNGTGQSSTPVQRVGSKRDDFGTVVTEITITRKKYCIED